MIVTGVYECEEVVWFTALEMAVLFEYNKKDKTIRIATTLSDDVLNSKEYYGHITKWMSKLCIIPLKSDTVIIYDLENQQSCKLRFESDSIGVPKYRSFAQKENKVYAFGFYENSLLEIDIEKESVSVHKGLGGQLFCGSDSNMYLVEEKSNKISKLVKIDSAGIEIQKNVNIRDYTLSFCFKDICLCVNKETGIIKRLKDKSIVELKYPEGFVKSDNNFVFAYSDLEGVIFVPLRGNMKLKYVYESDSLLLLEKYENNKLNVFNFAGEIKDKIWYSSNDNNTLMMLHKNTHEIEDIRLSNIKGLYETVMKNSEKIVYENFCGMSLSNLIEGLVNE